MEKPLRPYFGSGPTVKPKGWSLHSLSDALISRSHRSVEGQKAIEHLLSLVRDVLNIPHSHHLLLVPGSATGAIQMAMWNFLGSRPVTICTHDVFGKRWFQDIKTNMKNVEAYAHNGVSGYATDLQAMPVDHDVLFLWNNSTCGTKISDGAPVQPRDGLVLCDATSAVYGMPIPWASLDATAFSWQKGLGGEAGFGMLVLSPKAIMHLNTVAPCQSVPFILNIRACLSDLIAGKTLNTVSMLCLQDIMWCHQWAMSKGRLSGLIEKSKSNFSCIERWVEGRKNTKNPAYFMAKDPLQRSSTTVCIGVKHGLMNTWSYYETIAAYLKEQRVAYDILNHAAAEPCFRIWCGPTVEADDLEKLLNWLDFTINNSQN